MNNIPERRESDKRVIEIDGVAKEVEELIVQHRATKEMVEAMAVAIQGEPVRDFEYNIIEYRGGMKNQLNALEHAVKNGGIPAKVKLTVMQKVFGFGTASVYLFVEMLRFLGRGA